MNFALVAALEKKGALGDIPEKPPIPPGIPDKVKEKILKLKPKVPKPKVAENEEEEEK